MYVSKEWLLGQEKREADNPPFLPDPTKNGWPLKHLCSWCGEYDTYGEKHGDWVNDVSNKGTKDFLCGRCLDEVDWNPHIKED